MISSSSYRAVIFDMDGVLIDSEPLWKIAMEEAFKSVGCNLTKKDFQKTVGLRIDEVITFWYNEVGWSGKSPKEMEDFIIFRMVELIKKHGKPLLGVVDTLQYLRGEKIKIGLATSSYMELVVVVLETLGITDLFDAVNSAETESHGKPHPAVYLTTAKLLDVDPLQCLVVEDSLNGIISGKAARMAVVCIPEKTHVVEPKLNFADFVFNDMATLLTELKK